MCKDGAGSAVNFEILSRKGGHVKRLSIVYLKVAGFSSSILFLIVYFTGMVQNSKNILAK
jgi:hypothetical protein